MGIPRTLINHAKFSTTLRYSGIYDLNQNWCYYVLFGEVELLVRVKWQNASVNNAFDYRKIVHNPEIPIFFNIYDKNIIKKCSSSSTSIIKHLSWFFSHKLMCIKKFYNIGKTWAKLTEYMMIIASPNITIICYTFLLAVIIMCCSNYEKVLKPKKSILYLLFVSMLWPYY